MNLPLIGLRRYDPRTSKYTLDLSFTPTQLQINPSAIEIAPATKPVNKETDNDTTLSFEAQLIYSTQIPAGLGFLARSKQDGLFRGRRGSVWFIDARKLG